MAADTWYYAKDGNQAGPVSADTLRRMLADGQLRIGLISGIYALTQVRKFGPQGIRTPAIVGVVLNALIVAAFVGVIVLAASR
jgi:hypothetical protein